MRRTPGLRKDVRMFGYAGNDMKQIIVVFSKPKHLDAEVGRCVPVNSDVNIVNIGSSG